MHSGKSRQSLESRNMGFASFPRIVAASQAGMHFRKISVAGAGCRTDRAGRGSSMEVREKDEQPGAARARGGGGAP